MKELDARSLALAQLDVSRETLQRIDRYASLLTKWNPKINLVAKSTIKDLWTRHIADSLQVSAHFGEQDRVYCDFGTGGGLPGLVVAAVLEETHPNIRTTLVESDHRKSAFLLTAAREMDLNVHVETKRIEDMSPLNADVISARALASLPKLLAYCAPHIATNGRCLFLKGATFRNEMHEALEHWRFDSKEWVSKTNDESVLLEIRNITHV